MSSPEPPVPYQPSQQQPAEYQPVEYQPGQYQQQPAEYQPDGYRPDQYPPVEYQAGQVPSGTPLPDAPAPTPRARIGRREVRDAIVLTVVLIVVGVALAFAWSAWAHGSSRAGSTVYSTIVGNIPDETEGFVAGDGRFAALTGAVGLLAGIVMWSVRRSRGPVVALALGVGGTAGALLTAIIGHLVSAGRTSAPVNQAFIPKLTVHAQGLFALEGGLALLVYIVLSLVVSSDALGREDDDRAVAPPAPPMPQPVVN